MAWTVPLDFARFDKVTLTEIADELGIYVFWNGRALRAPTYIGQGEFLQRYIDHKRKGWAHRPLDGYVAFVDSKSEALFGEWALLEVAEDIGLWPRYNQIRGQKRGIENIRRIAGAEHRTFKVTITGRDPFCPPERSRDDVRKAIAYERDSDGFTLPRHDWNRRYG